VQSVTLVHILEGMTHLARIRQERQLSLEQLSGLIALSTGVRISFSELSRIERGLHRPWSRNRAAIARTLNVDPELLWRQEAA
jgi:transcriptional regulator with XRE-family HTH domain